MHTFMLKIYNKNIITERFESQNTLWASVLTSFDSEDFIISIYGSYKKTNYC